MDRLLLLMTCMLCCCSLQGAGVPKPSKILCGTVVPVSASCAGGVSEVRVPGLGSGALLCRKGTVVFSFREFPRQGGTVSCWVSPHEWDAQDGSFHILVSLRPMGKSGQGDRILLYRYGNSDPHSTGLGICLRHVRGDRLCGIVNFPNHLIGRSWCAGSWHHLVFTFDVAKGSCQFYMDEELIGISRIAPEFGSETELVLGPEWGSAAGTLFGRLLVTSTVMTQEEIEAEYEMVKTDMEEQK